jgi:lycopene epsilon-cyclase
VGCGPAGLKLAAELAKLGLTVALVGRDAPFVNNYGVWIDEFEALGLESTLDAREWGGISVIYCS